jgi:hypothetical protein
MDERPHDSPDTTTAPRERWQPKRPPLAADQVPYDAPTRKQFEALSAEERAAAYLNSIRRMMVWFVALSVVGIVAAVVVGVMAIAAIHGLHQPTGYGLGQ